MVLANQNAKLTDPDQGFLVSLPRPHTKALGTRLRKLFYVFNMWITRTTATRHPLPVTRYPLPVTCYPSPATRHPPPAENTCRQRGKIGIATIQQFFSIFKKSWNFTKKILNYLIFLKFYKKFYQNFILPKLSQKLPNFTKSKLI